MLRRGNPTKNYFGKTFYKIKCLLHQLNRGNAAVMGLVMVQNMLLSLRDSSVLCKNFTIEWKNALKFSVTLLLGSILSMHCQSITLHLVSQQSLYNSYTTCSQWKKIKKINLFAFYSRKARHTMPACQRGDILTPYCKHIEPFDHSLP